MLDNYQKIVAVRRHGTGFYSEQKWFILSLSILIKIPLNPPFSKGDFQAFLLVEDARNYVTRIFATKHLAKVKVALKS